MRWSEQLAGVAREWSRTMADRGVLEHQDLAELLRADELAGLRGVGENVFTGSGSVTSGRMHVGWMRSDDHRVNFVNPGWDRLGVGVFCAPDGTVWATQQFGRTAGADLPPVTQETPSAGANRPARGRGLRLRMSPPPAGAAVSGAATLPDDGPTGGPNGPLFWSCGSWWRGSRAGRVRRRRAR